VSDATLNPRDEVVLVLGDSHASVFRSEHMAREMPGFRFEVIAVGGATVSGLPNPNPVSQAMPQFRAALAATVARKVIVIMGEVDTGFVIWYRAQKYETSVDEMCALALEQYQQLLLDIGRSFNVICISTPLPTILDHTDWGEVANLRKEVTASQSQRTELTLRFNMAMQDFCERHAIHYLALDKVSLGDDGLLKDGLRNPDPSDHHYDPLAYAALIAPVLRPMLASS